MTVAASLSTVRRILLPLILAASLIASLVCFVGMTRGLALLSVTDETNLIGLQHLSKAQGPQALDHVSALVASPLDQQAVNGVIAARARATGNVGQATKEIGLLHSLGWRGTNALQNLLWRSAMTNDLPLMMDTLDALLRREKLLGQIYPILNLMTTDAAFRNLLTQRLATRPPWRRYYFLSASDLSRPAEIQGRFLVMQAIQRTGDRLTRNEIAPILPKLVGIGQTGEAFALWRSQAGKVTMPLADTNFVAAARPIAADALPIPFEWQLGSGSGYFADASRDEHGSFMSIDWNGRGTPSFASQQTSARSGRYRLVVAGDTPASVVVDRIGFRLVCPGGATTNFSPVGPRNGTLLQFTSTDRVACDYPELQLYGLVQTGSAAASIVLRSVRLARID